MKLLVIFIDPSRPCNLLIFKEILNMCVCGGGGQCYTGMKIMPNPSISVYDPLIGMSYAVLIYNCFKLKVG